MRDYKSEFEKRVKFIKSVIAESGAKGIVYGNSGGKDSALVGILCKAACDNTIGLIVLLKETIMKIQMMQRLWQQNIILKPESLIWIL